ncbi:MAG TPA: HAD family phosphatase [Candidatus Lokiarchaeia archaeon]|nr:HAD family phosphatase [Candidatus Lokiarchaeia archaeon]
MNAKKPKHESRYLKTTLSDAQGFIFDMDGTILNSHEAHYRAWDHVTKDYGFSYEKEDIVAQFGKTTAAIATILCETDDLATIQEISKAKEAYFIDEIPSIQLFEGVTNVFTALKRAGKRICIASSNNNLAIEKIINQFQLEHLVDGFIGLDDIVRGKPDPEMIVKSAVKLDLDPGDCIVIGDSIYDIQASIAARARCAIGVLTGTTATESLKNAGAIAVLQSVKELINHIKK